MEWLKQIAPTIATAMGGPLAGMAVSAISKAIGVEPEKVGDLISNNKLSAEQIASIKVAEIELQKQANELGLNFEKLAVDDRKSAREMQAATRSWVPPLLAGSVTVGFFAILGANALTGYLLHEIVMLPFERSRQDSDPLWLAVLLTAAFMAATTLLVWLCNRRGWYLRL